MIGRTALAFAGARWGRRFADRAALLRFQERRLARFLATTLPRAPFYRAWAGRPLAELPIVDKAAVLADFAAFNTRGVTLDQALAVALAAERSRDFRPQLDGDLTVGLSSGTSGTRGVFLVGAAERARWAGVLLARLLAPAALRRLLDPRRPPLRVALFLRADSNLYGTLASRRLAFSFHDLLAPLDAQLERLAAQPPDILTAPPTVLRRLAAAQASGALALAPLQVISVAEVLEADDRQAVERAFGVPVQQIYQAAEGFLGASCPAGRVHWNEDLVHLEPDWLDGERRRFQPIVTDFSRTTQLVVRYRLDDVLVAADGPCPCGRPSRSLEAIAGRADEVLWAAPLAGGEPVAVFPDLLRRAFALVSGLRDYRLEQHGAEWRLRLDAPADSTGDAGGGEAAVRREILELAHRLAVRPPALRFEAWRPEPPDHTGDKRRRIRCAARHAPEVAVR